VLCGQNQGDDPLDDLRRRLNYLQVARGPAGAPLLVVVGLRIVDDIVIPDGRFHLGRMLGQFANLIEQG
jgi:hypothetical protein